MTASWFWENNDLQPKYDIAKLLPMTLSKGKRFETLDDAQLLSAYLEDRLPGKYARTLAECSWGQFRCHKTYCPVCGRLFRRWLTGELLRITEGHECHFLTVALGAAPRGQLDQLNPADYGHMLRKRLDRSGLSDVPAIGGIECAYRADHRDWILHMNVVTIGAREADLRKFCATFKDGSVDRPTQLTRLNDRAEQLSYLLKFSTYHRPHQQSGSSKPKAVPLNKRELVEIVSWMSKREFRDFLFLFKVGRRKRRLVVNERS